MEKGLVLNTSYNDFILGTHISNYFYKKHSDGEISDDPLDETVYFDFYEEAVDVWCVNDIINSIRCDTTCIYDGFNLIGMKFDDFQRRFRFTPDDEDIIWIEGKKGKNGQNQHVYNFEKEGLQIWVWRNIIRTVIISDYTNCTDLVLNKSYEEFELNTPISNYFYKKFKELKQDEVHPFKRYCFASLEAEIWCRDNMIDTIKCDRLCAYEYKGKSINLIGLGYKAFLKIFDVQSPKSKQMYVDADGKKELRHVYEFDELGLQLWVWHNRIMTVLVYNTANSKLQRVMI